MDRSVTATACGRLSDVALTVGNPSEVDCSECEEARLGVATVQYIRKLGVEAGALAAINEIFGPVIAGSDERSEEQKRRG